MTYRFVADRLARMIGVFSLDPAANSNAQNMRGLAYNDLEDLLACIQGAAQEIYTLCPAETIERRQGAVLRPPASVTVNCTQYSTACTITGFASWMGGCTMRIGGDNLDNALISATELLRPYMGSTATGLSATVYCDCLTVDPKYDMVIEPVEFPNRAILPLVNSAQRFRMYGNPSDYRSSNPADRGWCTTNNKSIAEPLVCMATFEALGTAAPSLYLRVNPMPGVAYQLTYTARLAPPAIALADIWNEGSPTVDPGVSCYLPMAEATLLPFALQRWTAHPSFSAEGEQRQEIARGYQAALTMLKRRHPQTASTKIVYSE